MDRKEIYLAGGCFWGTEKFFKSIPGVLETETGYANGKTEHPTYEEVCYRGTGHAETVRIVFDTKKLSLEELLEAYFLIIDPVSINRQGPDQGEQYRTGIFYLEEKDLFVIENCLKTLEEEVKEPLAIQVQLLNNYFKAEEYHQNYLDKNPNGYCHINLKASLDLFQKKKQAIVKKNLYQKKDFEQLKKELTNTQFLVTQKNETEPAFQNEYWNHYEKGIYVDITTGEPLFLSNDKYESGCGWPSFSKPIDPFVMDEYCDFSHDLERTEVRSRVGNAHLGHVFNDGIKEKGGLRYCINSASLRFIPLKDMEKEGYGDFIHFVQ